MGSTGTPFFPQLASDELDCHATRKDAPSRLEWAALGVASLLVSEREAQLSFGWRGACHSTADIRIGAGQQIERYAVLQVAGVAESIVVIARIGRRTTARGWL